MTGLIILMVREFKGHVTHVRVFPGGELEQVNSSDLSPKEAYMVTADLAEVDQRRRTRAGSQLLSVRHLVLMGWRVADPSLWEEAES